MNITKFKVGDFVGSKKFSGSKYYEILKIEGDTFWINYEGQGFKDYHQYLFSKHSCLHIKPQNEIEYEFY